MKDRFENPIKYWYERWIIDCEESAIYCDNKGEHDRAQGYRNRKAKYENRLRIIRSQIKPEEFESKEQFLEKNK